MAAECFPDAFCEQIEPLLPSSSRAKTGRPPVDNTKALSGILFVLKFVVPWRTVPTDAFGGSGSSCWRRFSEWTRAGVWPRGHRRLLNRLRRLGGVDFRHVVVDSQSGRAVKGGITPDQTPPIAARRGANAIC